MIDTINSAMLELQGTLHARCLYPSGHPSIASGVEQSCAQLGQALQDRAKITVFCVDNRVICDDEVLPSSAGLARDLFHVLYRKGVDRITFRAGFEAGDVHHLLDGLMDDKDGKQRPLQSTSHVEFGFIRGEVDVAPAPHLRSVDLIPIRQLADKLDGVWQDIYEGHLDTEGLDEIIINISRAVSDSALLPLASIKKHDEYTFVHTINVSILSTALGEAVGIEGRTVQDLTMAALTHDVGKRIIPDQLLNKNGRFTEEEFRVVQLHPVEGARLLFGTPGTPDLSPIVAYEHHIHADGSGYPRVPRGWRLNLASRVVQVADVFDALRTNRPYRAAIPMARILEIMYEEVGAFCDADLLEVFFAQVVSRGIAEPEDTPAADSGASIENTEHEISRST